MFDNIARLINCRIDLELSCSASCWTRLHDTYDMNSHRGMIACPWLFLHLLYIYTPSAITVIVVSVRAPDLFGGHNIWIEDRGVYICISEYLLGPVYTSKSSLFLFARKNISVSLDSWLQGVGKEQDYSSVPFLLLCWARKKNRMDGMNRLVWCWLVITESERKKWNSLAINTRNPVFHSMFGY